MGERHEPFTAENAKEFGSKGGKAAAEAKKYKKAIRDIAEEILTKKITNEQIVERMIRLGIINRRPKASVTVGQAIIGACVERAVEDFHVTDKDGVVYPDGRVMAASNEALKLFGDALYDRRADGERQEGSGAPRMLILPDAEAVDEFMKEPDAEDAE